MIYVKCSLNNIMYYITFTKYPLKYMYTNLILHMIEYILYYMLITNNIQNRLV